MAQTPTDSQAQLGLTEPPPYQVGQTLDLFGAFVSGPADALDAVLTVTATSGVTFLSVTPSHPTQPLSCNLNSPQEVVCTRDVVRGSTEIFISMRFDAPGDHTFTATASQSNPDPNPDNNTVGGTITVEGGPPMPGAISGVKWHDQNENGEQDGGEPGLSGWTIFVDENGNGTLDGGEPSAATGSDGSYQISDLDPDTYIVREVLQEGWQQTFPASGAHTVVVLAGQTTENIDFGNVQPVSVSEADLSVEKTVSPGQALEDDVLTYTITVTNAGPDEAVGVFIEDVVFKDSLEIIVASLPPSCVRIEDIDDDAGLAVWVVECRPGDLAPGANVTMNYQAFARAIGTVSNEVEASSDATDPNLSNNIAIATAVVEGAADLAVIKTVAPDTLVIDRTLFYEIFITNNGPSDATNIRLRDLVHADSLEFDPSTLPQECVLMVTNTLMECTIPALAAGATTLLKYKALSKRPGVVTNFVNIISSDLPDPNLENNQAKTRAFVGDFANVSTVKTATAAGAPADTVEVGTVLSYTVTVTSLGPAPAVGMRIEDVESDSLSVAFIPASISPNCTYGPFPGSPGGVQLIMCPIDFLAVGESVTVSYQALTKKVGTFSNLVFLAHPGALGGDRFAEVSTVVVPATTTVDYTLNASASTTTAQVGEEVDFNFSLSADGVTESGTMTITASDAWTDPVPRSTRLVVDGDTMAVVAQDSVSVEVDPEGFPAGTTRITYTYPDGFPDGRRYDGTLTLTAALAGASADKSQARASVLFEAFVPGNDDPNPADDVVEVFVDIEDTGTAMEPDPGSEIPQVVRLHGNYPNSFNPETTIRFDLKERAPVRLQVFNVLGQVVETLVDEPLAPGTYRAVFDAQGLPSGTYFYRLEAGAFSQTKPMVLLK